VAFIAQAQKIPEVFYKSTNTETIMPPFCVTDFQLILSVAGHVARRGAGRQAVQIRSTTTGGDGLLDVKTNARINWWCGIMSYSERAFPMLHFKRAEENEKRMDG
jgi:hypothetical protein